MTDTPERPHAAVASRPLLVALAALVLLLAWAYGNHFRNPFEFDDAHTIVSNEALRDLGNIPRFFTDATTSSTLPANQSWRPLLTTVEAFETWLGGGTPNPAWFHAVIFLAHVALAALVFLLLLELLRSAFGGSVDGRWPALFGAAWFALHTANAETVNYISAQSDVGSTLLAVLSVVLYVRVPSARRTYLFLAPMAAGFLIKEAALMTAPLLLVYVWLFGEPDGDRAAGRRHVGAAFGAAVVLFALWKLMISPTWTGGGGAWPHYLATQAFVVVHYLNDFVLPLHLSADTDWTLVPQFTDDRVFAGLAVILVLCGVAWHCRRARETRPVTFGIAWFFIALAPTSSFFPFAEVLNDHRTYFPYIGLIIAVTTALVLLRRRLAAAGTHAGRTLSQAPVVASAAGVLLVAHAVGTHHRNAVWSSPRTLWQDVTEKSPGNGRGWMNYGLALMEGGDLNGAVAAYQRALSLAPGYSYAHINMGIALAAMGQDAAAEANFRQALVDDPRNPEGYYFYARYLTARQRNAEALDLLRKGQALSPQHAGIAQALAALQAAPAPAPHSPAADSLVAASLAAYRAGNYAASLASAEHATDLAPTDAAAWNNVCAAANELHDWDRAVHACGRAITLAPDLQVARNNLAVALRGQSAAGHSPAPRR